MPPKSSLPLRDGRVGLPRTSPPPYSTSSQVDHDNNDDDDDGNQQQISPDEPYYTDAEIELLNDIVTLGETILPTLPEQNRLPTEALFTAAEEVLPQHGYDADQPPPHISRLIFKIGGQRTGDTLGDKFRTVLEGMGVQLELVPTSPAGSISARSNRSSVISRRSTKRGAAAAAGSEVASNTATPAVGVPGIRPPEQVTRRRHSSTSSRPAISRFSPPGGRQEFNLPIRLGTGPGNGAGAGNGSGRPRALSLSDYDSDAALEDALLRRQPPVQNEAVAGGVQNANQMRQQPVNDENRRPVNPLLHKADALTHATKSTLFDIAAVEQQQDDTTPDLPILPFQAHVPIMDRSVKPPSTYDLAHVGGELSEPEGRDLSTVGDAEHVHPSPDTEGSGVLGASDASEETKDDSPYSPHYDHEAQGVAEDLHLLEGKLHQFKVQDGKKLLAKCLHNWRFNAIITRRDHGILELRAADYDDVDVFDEVLDIWQEEAIHAQQEKVAAQVAAEHEAYVAKMERRAQRVYEILTARDILSQWHGNALDEIERTAIARRHLVRKRAFDGWRAQHIEDETKVQNFVLIHALQKWTQVTLHLEVRKQVSVQRYERTLAQNVITTMWEENKGRLADEFYDFKVGQGCLRHWRTMTHEVMTEMEVAAASDDRLILYEVVDIWREECEEMQYRSYEGSMQLLAKGCLRDLEYWHEQARLRRTLKQFTAHQVLNTLNSTLSYWNRAASNLEHKSNLADLVLLRNPLAHWERQTKLQIFLSNQAHTIKSNTLTHWYLEERLAWYKRHTAQQTQLNTLNKFLTATRKSRSDRARATQEADAEYTYFGKLETVEKWMSAAAEKWKPRHNANLVYLYRTTMPVLDAWKKKHAVRVAKATRDRVVADVNARRCIVGNVLDVWPVRAERARRERMMTTLREFRRNYKIELAESCLDRWWEGTRDVIDEQRRAEQVLVESKAVEVNGWIEHWVDKAVENKALLGIAEDAEVEVWMGFWQQRMEELEELRGLAVALDAEKTIRGCWDRLEFQSLQRRAMGRSVAAVREKNDLRFCGRVLEEWYGLAIPDREGLGDEVGGEQQSIYDGRFSTLSVSRAGLRTRETPVVARSTSALGRQGGYFNDNRNVFTPAGSLMGGGGYQRGGGRATTTAHRAYTGGGVRGTTTFETPQTVQSQPPPPLPSVSQLGMPPLGTTSQQQQRTRLPRGSLHTTAASRPQFGSSISLLGPSATPAPQIPSLSTPAPAPATNPMMSEFDLDFDNRGLGVGDEDSLLLSLTGGRPGVGHGRSLHGDEDDNLETGFESDGDGDGQPPDLGFMSTPSRRLVRPGRTSTAAGGGGGGGVRGQPPLSRLAAFNAATTTPSAILASPYERELRRVYGQGHGQGQGQTQTRVSGSQSLGVGAGSGVGGGSQSLNFALGLGLGTQGSTQGQAQGRTRSLGPGAGGPALGRSLGRERERERGVDMPRGTGGGGGGGGGGGRLGKVVEFADIREESAEY